MTICMTKKEKKTEYKQFTNARLEPELHEWLKEKRLDYDSWNKLFRQIKKRYEESETT